MGRGNKDFKKGAKLVQGVDALKRWGGGGWGGLEPPSELWKIFSLTMTIGIRCMCDLSSKKINFAKYNFLLTLLFQVIWKSPWEIPIIINSIYWLKKIIVNVIKLVLVTQQAKKTIKNNAALDKLIN